VKLHDLRPAAGSTKARTRVGRGIAAGKGKTAGRGTKGQKARAGASIPAWFEGGQTPLHMRVPKLRGFRSINRIDYQVVNIGRISAYAEAGRLGELLTPKSPYTVNPEILRAAGLITRERQPVKILGAGEVSVPLFVLADAFTSSARSKVEAAGGSVQTIAAPEPAVETIQVPSARRTRVAEAQAARAEAAAAEAADADAAVAGADAPEAAAGPVEPETGSDTDASTEADATSTDAAPQA
jgi:large subunit ribosomal protein L15